jgi:hypothetical protein
MIIWFDFVDGRAKPGHDEFLLRWFSKIKIIFSLYG